MSQCLISTFKGSLQKKKCVYIGRYIDLFINVLLLDILKLHIGLTLIKIY